MGAMQDGEWCGIGAELLGRAALAQACGGQGTVALIQQNKFPGERRAEPGFQEHAGSLG